MFLHVLSLLSKEETPYLPFPCLSSGKRFWWVSVPFPLVCCSQTPKFSKQKIFARFWWQAESNTKDGSPTEAFWFLDCLQRTNKKWVTPADPPVRASLLWLLPFKLGSHATGLKFTQCLFFICIGIYFWIFARSLCSLVGYSLLVLDESLQFNFWFLSRSPTLSNMDSNMGRKQVTWNDRRVSVCCYGPKSSNGTLMFL